MNVPGEEGVLFRPNGCKLILSEVHVVTPGSQAALRVGSQPPAWPYHPASCLVGERRLLVNRRLTVKLSSFLRELLQRVM